MAGRVCSLCLCWRLVSVSNDYLKETAREVAHGVDDLGEFKGSDE